MILPFSVPRLLLVILKENHPGTAKLFFRTQSGGFCIRIVCLYVCDDVRKKKHVFISNQIFDRPLIWVELKKNKINLPTIRCAKSGCDDPENTLMLGILDCSGRGTLSFVSSVKLFVVDVNVASAAFASSPDKVWLPQVLFVFVVASINEWQLWELNVLGIKIYACFFSRILFYVINGVENTTQHNTNTLSMELLGLVNLIIKFSVFRLRHAPRYTIKNEIKREPSSCLMESVKILV